MSYIYKPQKYNIKSIQELGLTDADFTDATATDTVPNLKNIASQNLQKITDKMLLPQFYDRELKTEILKSEFPKLYNSLIFVFIPTLGTSATPTLTIKQGTKTAKVFEVALFSNTGAKYAKIYNDFYFYNSQTGPYLEKPEMFQANIDWKSIWTPTQDADATTKTFAEICGEMNVMAKEFGRGVVFRQFATSTTNPNLFRAVKEHTGSSSGGFRMFFNKYDAPDASSPMYIDIWDTGNNYYRYSSVLVGSSYQLFDIKGSVTQAVKVYEFTTTTTHSLPANSSVVIGKMNGQGGILSTDTTLRTYKSFGVTTGATDANGTGAVFSENGNPIVSGYVGSGLFKMNNKIHNNLSFEITVNLPNANIIPYLQRWDGTTWVDFKPFAMRSKTTNGEYVGDTTSFSTGMTDNFNVNTFRFALVNTTANAAVIPAQKIKLIVKGVQ